MIPIIVTPFELPEFPDKNCLMHDAIDRRLKNFYKCHSEGHMEIFPNLFEVYEYFKIDDKHKIGYQVIREGIDVSFIEGNYREYLVFYYCYKESKISFLPWEWFKKDWVIGGELPIELIEEHFNIPFREQWKQADEYRKYMYKKKLEFFKSMNSYTIY